MWGFSADRAAGDQTASKESRHAAVAKGRERTRTSESGVNRDQSILLVRYDWSGLLRTHLRTERHSIGQGAARGAGRIDFGRPAGRTAAAEPGWAAIEPRRAHPTQGEDQEVETNSESGSASVLSDTAIGRRLRLLTGNT